MFISIALFRRVFNVFLIYKDSDGIPIFRGA
jgi:hypothetical protein